MRHQTLSESREGPFNQSRILGWRPKRGRGRPAFRPFDLPSRYPLKRTSDDGDSSLSNESSKARLAQRRIDNYLIL